MLNSLRTQILLWTILPLALVLVGIAYLGVSNHQAAMRELVAERDAALARVSAARISELLTDRAHHLADLDATNSQMWDSNQFDGVALFNAQGQLLTATPNVASWFEGGLSPQAEGFSPPLLENGVWRVLITRRVKDQFLVGAVTLPSFNTLAPRGIAYIVDAQGRIVAHLDPARVGQDLSGHMGIAQVTRGETGATFHTDAQGIELVVGYAPISPTGWGLLIDEPWADVVAPMFQFSVLLPVVLVLVALVALGAIYFGVRNVVRPLQDLSQVANRIAFGDYHAAEIHVGGVREIEELRETLAHMANQVRAAQDAMQNYIVAITRGQEDERKRLARELHDDTIQSLIALQQRVEMTRKALTKDPVAAAAKLAELKDLIGESLTSVRGFVRDLRPTYLDELGLIPALEMLAQEAHAAFTVTGEEQRLDAERELVLFRITQEALRNVQKHAHATEVGVRLAFDANEVTVTVEDNGVGFDAPDAPTSYVRSGHFGLTGMQERAQLFGGNVYVKSTPGAGTKVVAFVPTKI